MNSKALLIGTTCLVAIALCPARVAAQQTVAQTGSDDPSTGAKDGDTRDTEIVVTGTRIVRLNQKSAAPISTLTAREIAAQGAINIEEALTRLPQVAPLSDQNNQDSEGRQRVGLRNLGFERTLTLVDGMRLGLNNGQDVGIIPTQLVERIDVLSGGASSVYGSDAIAGVVNFIMKKNFDGISLNGNYNFYNHGNKPGDVGAAAQRASFDQAPSRVNDGGRADVTLTVGKNLFDGAVNISAFANYRTAQMVPYASREIAACQIQQTTRDGPLSCVTSTYTASGTIQPRSGASAGQLLVNNPNGNGSFVPYGIGPGNAVNPFNDYSLQRSFDRVNAGGFLTAKLGSFAEAHASLLWYRDDSSRGNPARVLSFTAFGSTPYQVNCNNPFLSASQAQTICGAAAGTAALAPIDVRYRFNALPDVRDRYLNTGVRATFGLGGTIADAWHWDVTGMYSRNKGTTFSTPFPDFDKVNRSLNVVNVGGVPTCVAKRDGVDAACVPFNAFRPNNADTAVFNYLLTGPQGSQSGVPRLWQVVATASGDLGKYGIKSPFATQGLAFAVTGEYRDELFTGTADALYRQINGGTDSLRRQNVVEGNVEAQLPLIEDKSWTHLLQVNGGYRVSKYNRLADKFGTWKIEGLWSPIADVTFRASRNKAQRAPTVIELSQAQDISYARQGYGNDFCASTPDPNRPGSVVAPQGSRAACKATGLPDNLYGSTTLSCPDGFCTVRYGGFNIKPETAFTTTFGIVLKPRFLPGLTASLDRYIIDLNDSIGFNYDDFYSNGCMLTADPFYCSKIIRNPGSFNLFSAAGGNPTTGFIQAGTTNFYKATSHGWDFQAQYMLDLGAPGTLDFSLNGTRPTISGGQDAPNLSPRNCVGYFGPVCGTSFPKWQHSLRTTYAAPDDLFSVSLNWRYISPMTITYNVGNNPDLGIPFTAADQRNTYNGIPAYNYIDLSAAVSIAKRFRLRLGVNNLFDKAPPLVVNSTSIGSRNNTIAGRYDIMGRQITIGAGVDF